MHHDVLATRAADHMHAGMLAMATDLAHLGLFSPLASVMLSCKCCLGCLIRF